MIALALLVLLPVLAAGWLLGTTSGLRFAFARAAAALPELELEAGAIDGSLGAARFEGIRFRLAGRSVRIQRLLLDWRPLAAVAERIDVQRLEAAGIDIGPGDRGVEAEPFDPQRFVWTYPIPELPVSVNLVDVRLGRASLEGQHLWDGVTLAGSLDRRGRLTLQRLDAERGEDRLSLAGELGATGGAAGLAGRWRLSAVEGEVRISAEAQGAAVEIDADAGRAALRLAVRAPRSWQAQLRWDDARLDALLPGLPQPLQMQIALEGEGARASLQGEIEQGAVRLEALRGELSWLAERGTLAISALQARHPDAGEVRLEGELRLEQAIELALEADVQRWPLVEADREAGAPALRLSAGLSAQGRLDDLLLRLRGDLSRGEQRLPLELDAKLGQQQLRIERLLVDGAGGQLRGAGSLQFDPQLALDLSLEGEQLDPGWFDPQLSGSLALGATLEVRQVGNAWEARLELSRLAGRWKDLPVAGEGRLAWRGDALAGLLTLSAGDGRVRVFGERDSARIEIEQFQLGLLQPGLTGWLAGSVQLEGLPEVPRWDADLRVDGLRQDALQVDSVTLSGGLDPGGSRSLSMAWQGAQLAPQLGAMAGALQVNGSLADYRARLQTAGEALSLRADWSGQLSDAPAMRLEALHLQSDLAGDWRLDDAAAIRLAAPWQVEPLCLLSEQARLCLQTAEPQADGIIEVELRGLPLARIAALAGSPEQLAVGGEVSARARLRSIPAVELLDVSGGLSGGSVVDTALETPRSLVEWASAQWTLVRETDRLRIDASADLLPAGRVSLDLLVDAAAPQDSSRWDGQMQIDVAQLQALALLAPDVSAAQGALRGGLRWTPGLPPDGEIALEDFSARVAALGIEFRDSSLSLRQGDTGLLLDGLLDTGEGPLRVEGEVQSGPSPRARVRVAGEGVLLADTPRLALRASPDLRLGWREGLLTLRGQLHIPSALIDLERLEAGVQPSPDVVVLDPREARQGAAALPLDADLQITLGDQVKLSGFGFDGRIAGQLGVREQPGRAMIGRGTLDLSGHYRAYGQELDIERGRLLFASSALDNPGIDLRARRPLREVEVGVEVRGPARNPRLSLWSRPAMDQAEALSWLVLGQPLASATEADGAQLGQAAAAMGGNLLAARIGGRLGLDTFGVADSEALGGAAFTVGKYLSPKLYLSYGVSLFDEGTVVTLRYLLSRQFDIELESARESRAGVNYRLETD